MILTRCLFCRDSAFKIWFWGPGWFGICGLRFDDAYCVKVAELIDLEVLGGYARSKRLLGSDMPKGKKDFFHVRD